MQNPDCRFTAVLLDVDGTLVSSNDAHAAAWQGAFGEFTFDVAYERLRRMIGMGAGKILPNVDASLSDDAEPGRSIAKRRAEIFRERYLKDVHATNGARRMVETLRGCGMKIVIASSAKGDELHALLSIAGVADLVDVGTTSDDAGETKPAPDIIEAALKKAQVGAANAIMVGDTPYDIESASRAGLATVAFRSGGWDDAGLSAALAIYDDPADLLAHLSESPLSFCR